MRKRIVQLWIAIAAVVTVATVGIPFAAANEQSQNTAGVFSVTNAFNAATARVQVPDVPCAPGVTHHRTLNVNWSGPNNNDAGLTVHMDCSNGTEALVAVLTETDLTGHKEKTLPVAEGDVFNVSMTYDSGTGVFKATGRNVTQNVTTGLRRVSPGLVFEHANYYLFNISGPPIPVFTTIPFSKLTLDGGAAELEFTVPTYVNLVNTNTGHTLIKTNAFNVAGNAFKLTFKTDQ